MNKKVLVLAWVVAAIVAALFWMSQSPQLFKNGQSEYAIVLCDNASSSEKTAAEELQAYLRQISGAELPLINAVCRDTHNQHVHQSRHHHLYHTDMPQDDYDRVE